MHRAGSHRFSRRRQAAYEKSVVRRKLQSCMVAWAPCDRGGEPCVRAALFLVPGMLGVVPIVYPESPRSWLEVLRLGVRVRARVGVSYG